MRQPIAMAIDGRGRLWIAECHTYAGIEIGFGGVWALTSPTLVFIPVKDGDDRPEGPAEVRLDGFEWKQNHHTMANGSR